MMKRYLTIEIEFDRGVSFAKAMAGVEEQIREALQQKEVEEYAIRHTSYQLKKLVP